MSKTKDYFLKPPDNCLWDSWSQWSCSVDKWMCGETGIDTRTRTKALDLAKGIDCDGPTEETRSCNNGECTGKF